MNLLYALFALDLFNIAVLLPVFGPFVRSIGGTAFTLGLLNSSSALVSLLWNPVVGSLSDQVGRKSILIKCLAASAAGSIILAGSSSLLLVFIGKLIGSLGSPVGIILRSVVADTYRTSEEKKIFFNKCAPLMSISFLVGSLSSGFLSEAKNGYSLAFLLIAVVSGVATFISIQTIPDTVKKTPNKENQKNTSLISQAVHEIKSALLNIRTISWPRYKDLFYIKGFYDFSMAMIISNVGLILLNEYNVKGRTIGYVFMAISICRIVTNLLKLRIKNFLLKVQDKTILIIGGLTLFMCYIIMGVSPNLSIFLIFLCTMCVSREFMDTTLTEIVTTKTRDSDRGKVIGAFENLFSFAMFVAPLVSGTLAEAFGERVLVASASIPITVAVVVAYRETVKTD